MAQNIGQILKYEWHYMSVEQRQKARAFFNGTPISTQGFIIRDENLDFIHKNGIRVMTIEHRARMPPVRYLLVYEKDYDRVLQLLTSKENAKQQNVLINLRMKTELEVLKKKKTEDKIGKTLSKMEQAVIDVNIVADKLEEKISYIEREMEDLRNIDDEQRSKYERELLELCTLIREGRAAIIEEKGDKVMDKPLSKVGTTSSAEESSILNETVLLEDSNDFLWEDELDENKLNFHFDFRVEEDE